MLRGRLSKYFADNPCDGLFIASLDHSPTEQLIGEKWHTSALILSAAVEHSALANELGEIANPLTGRLTKWARANSHYRQRFFTGLMSGLHRHRVLVFAISATESAIAGGEEQFIKEIGGSQCYRRQTLNGRARVSIGPLVNTQTGETQTIELPGNQAPMVLFIVHFLRRMHQEMHAALFADTLGHITWNFFADKPPNGQGGAFDQALAVLLGVNNPRGALRWGYFLEGDKVETDLLSDNIAGLLNEIMRVPQRYPDISDEPASGDAGLFYWEHWLEIGKEC